MKRILTIMAAVILAAGSGWAASYHPVLEQERGFVGATHVASFTYADMTETNVNTPQTNSTLFSVKAKQRVELIGMELVTAFNAGNNATGSVCVTVGDGAAGADFYLDSTELNSNKTEVWSKFGRAYSIVATTTLNYAGTNDPAVVVTKETATLDYAATNDPAVVVTKETATLDYAATNDPAVTLVLQTTTGYDSTGVAITNAAGEAIAMVTGVTATATLTAGAAVEAMTNAAGSATLTAGAAVAAMTNAAATATVTAGSLAVVTGLTDSGAGRKVYTVADTIDFVFTPNAVNALSENTAGEVRFYFKVIR